MLEAIDLAARTASQPVVTNAMVDEAFEQVLETNKNFEDWRKRLEDYHDKKAFTFINEILKYAAHHERITIQVIYDKANDPIFNRTEDYMDFVEQLLYDGYLIEEEKHVYRFISPFLKQFWLRKYPVYHG